MIRVLVADDHVVVRKGLIHILAREPEIRVVGEAANYGELRKILQETPVDVMLLDTTPTSLLQFATSKQRQKTLMKKW